MTYLIHTAVLRAALFSAANDKVRYYLNGVHVGADGFICSTDGHRMFFGQLMDESARPAKDFIIPLGTLKKALAGHKAVTIEFDETRVMDQLYTPVDGHFPDWRRVVPAACTGETAQFNGAYLSDMEKVGELLCAVPVVHHNGGSPAGVSFTGRPDCGAVLMPMRREDAWAPVCHSADVLRSAAAALAPVEPEAFTPAEVAAIEAEAKVIAPQAEPEVTAARAKRARPIEPQTFNPPASIWADPEAEATIAPRRSKPAAQPVDMDRAAMLSARAHKAVATRRARAAARAAA